MTDAGRAAPVDPAAVAAVLSDVVGLALTEADGVARREGLYVEDRTGPGWFTQDQDPRRVAVVLDADGLVVRATQG